MDFDNAMKRMDALKGKFNPHNPEHIAELTELWALMLPTIEAVNEWWNSLPDLAKTIPLIVEPKALSYN